MSVQHHSSMRTNEGEALLPFVCFVNVQRLNRVIYFIFQRFNLEWKTRTLSVFPRAA